MDASGGGGGLRCPPGDLRQEVVHRVGLLLTRGVLDVRWVLDPGATSLNLLVSLRRSGLRTRPLRHDQCLQNSPDQKTILEPAYILVYRKLIPESVNAVESVLRTELLVALPKFMADACVRHGYCTAKLIIWYIMKQLILPPDVNEVTMQKETLISPKIPPSTLDEASKWLEEMQHRLNSCIKAKQNVHPRALVAL